MNYLIAIGVVAFLVWAAFSFGREWSAYSLPAKVVVAALLVGVVLGVVGVMSRLTG